MDKKIDNLYRNDKTDEAIHQLIKKLMSILKMLIITCNCQPI